jgi:hypothetical protein
LWAWRSSFARQTERPAAHAVTDQHGSFALRKVAPVVYALFVSGAGTKPLAVAMESEQPLAAQVIAALNKARNALSPQTSSTPSTASATSTATSFRGLDARRPLLARNTKSEC